MAKPKSELTYRGEPVTYEQAARVLNISVPSLSTRLMRARRAGKPVKAVEILESGSQKYRKSASLEVRKVLEAAARGQLPSPVSPNSLAVPTLSVAERVALLQAQMAAKKAAAQLSAPTPPPPPVHETFVTVNEKLSGGEVYMKAVERGIPAEKANELASLYVRKNFAPGTIEWVLWFEDLP